MIARHVLVYVPFERKKKNNTTNYITTECFLSIYAVYLLKPSFGLNWAWMSFHTLLLCTHQKKNKSNIIWVMNSKMSTFPESLFFWINQLKSQNAYFFPHEIILSVISSIGRITLLTYFRNVIQHLITINPPVPIATWFLRGNTQDHLSILWQLFFKLNADNFWWSGIHGK